jgi:hypothetical protein
MTAPPKPSSNGWKLDGALKTQCYSRLATELLTESGDIDLTHASSLPKELTQAFDQIHVSSPDWTGIGNHLALLRRPQFQNGTEVLWNTYIGAADKKLKLAVVFWYGTLTKETFGKHLQYVWDVTEPISDLLPVTGLPDSVKAVGQLIPPEVSAQVSPYLSVLDAIVHFSTVEGGPHVSFIAACESPSDPELAKTLDTESEWAWKYKSALKWEPPQVCGYCWDVQSGQVHGANRGGVTIADLELQRDLAV